jgi:hypothetical protein
VRDDVPQLNEVQQVEREVSCDETGSVLSVKKSLSYFSGKAYIETGYLLIDRVCYFGSVFVLIVPF